MTSSKDYLKSSFHIDKQKVRNQKCFVFGDRKYSIDFDLIIKNSNYFYKNRQQFEKVENINLLNDEEIENSFPVEAIEAFISSCQNKPCQINSTSIFALQYLSYKYEFPEITNITTTFINEHSDELVLESLLFKINNNKEKEEGVRHENLYFDTSKEEETITQNLEKFIEDKNMKKVPISILERIIRKYSTIKKNSSNNEKEKIINFLFEILEERGSECSILFNNVDFGECSIGVMNRLLNEYSNKFDFNMINSTLLKTTTELTSELIKQKEEYTKIFSKMKQDLDNEKEEVSRIRLLEEERRIKYEKQLAMIEKKYENEVEKIRKENEDRIENIEKQFQKIISEYEDIIKKGSIQQHQKITIETMTFTEFDKLSDESKQYYIKTVIENKNLNYENQELIQNILFCNHLFDILPYNDENSRISFIKNHINECTISFDILEKYYLDGKLKNIITEFIQISSSFNIEMKYPTNSFDDILQIILDIQKQYSNKNIKIVTRFYDKEQNQICQIGKEIDSKRKENYHDIVESIFQKLTSANNSDIPITFYGCNWLTQISIPSYVKSIFKSAFANCSTLNEITIPTSVTKIGYYAFENCKCLTQIIIPSSVTYIDKGAFNHCTSLTQMTIPSSVKAIKEYSFSYCSSLVKISIPSSVTEIGRYSFDECSSLIEISIPSSLTKIENCVFRNCKSLIQISIPPSVISIGSEAFLGCTSLKQVSIPSSVTKIENYAFLKCISLEQISIPPSVVSIGYEAFCGCTMLKKISIPSSVKSISSEVINGCTFLTQISNSSSINLKDFF